MTVTLKTVQRLLLFLLFQSKFRNTSIFNTVSHLWQLDLVGCEWWVCEWIIHIHIFFATVCCLSDICECMIHCDSFYYYLRNWTQDPRERERKRWKFRQFWNPLEIYNQLEVLIVARQWINIKNTICVHFIAPYKLSNIRHSFLLFRS